MYTAIWPHGMARHGEQYRPVINRDMDAPPDPSNLGPWHVQVCIKLKIFDKLVGSVPTGMTPNRLQRIFPPQKRWNNFRTSVTRRAFDSDQLLKWKLLSIPSNRSLAVFCKIRSPKEIFFLWWLFKGFPVHLAKTSNHFWNLEVWNTQELLRGRSTVLTLFATKRCCTPWFPEWPAPGVNARLPAKTAANCTVKPLVLSSGTGCVCHFPQLLYKLMCILKTMLYSLPQILNSCPTLINCFVGVYGLFYSWIIKLRGVWCVVVYLVIPLFYMYCTGYHGNWNLCI